MTRCLLVLLVFLVGCGRPAEGGWATILGPDGTPLDFDSLFSDNQPILVARNVQSGELVADFDLEADTGGLLRIPALPDGEEAVLMTATCPDLVFPVPLPREPMRLTRGLPVRLRLTTDGDLPPESLQVGCTFTWRGPGDAPDAIARRDLVTNVVFPPGESEAVFHVSVPARYRVTWKLSRTTGSAGAVFTESFGAVGVGTSIVVTDQPEEQEFELFLDPAPLEEALQRLQR